MHISWYELPHYCEMHVAEVLAKPILVKRGTPLAADWNAMREEMRPKAREKIDAMTNIELLSLIAEVMGNNA